MRISIETIRLKLGKTKLNLMNGPSQDSNRLHIGLSQELVNDRFRDLIAGCRKDIDADVDSWKNRFFRRN